jgi:hypothetical protein
VDASYYIAKGQKTLGPCTLDDLRNFLAYGSIQKGDLVMREGDPQWRPVASVMEIAASASSAAGEEALPNSTLRRRTVRYRDYERVPADQRAGWVLKWAVLGFLFFPPLLWRAAVSVYSHRIFRAEADADGYLKRWPRRMDVPLTLLIMVNGILWCFAVTWVTHHTGPVAREFFDALRAGLRSVREILG